MTFPPGVAVRELLDGSSGAVFGGAAEEYRYLLWRQAQTAQSVRQATFLMLNPSTATEHELDATLRRCWHFTHMSGCHRMEVVNLFAYRATEPRDMKSRGAAAVGDLNDWFILDSCARANVVVCGWGLGGTFMERSAAVVAKLRSVGIELYALATTKNGHPGHPLYLPDAARPVPFLGWA